MLGCFDCITRGLDESVRLIIEGGGAVGLLYERDSPWVSKVWYIFCISESSLVQSCTSILLRYLLVMIPTLRIRNYVVLLLIFIINLLHF